MSRHTLARDVSRVNLDSQQQNFVSNASQSSNRYDSMSKILLFKIESVTQDRLRYINYFRIGARHYFSLCD